MVFFKKNASLIDYTYYSIFNSHPILGRLTNYYTNAKMDEAYRRLKSGKYTVSEVGYDMGYSNLSKFSEMFKKLKGLSPRDVITLK